MNCNDCAFYEGDGCPLKECDFKPVAIEGLTEIDFDKPGA